MQCCVPYFIMLLFVVTHSASKCIASSIYQLWACPILLLHVVFFTVLYILIHCYLLDFVLWCSPLPMWVGFRHMSHCSCAITVCKYFTFKPSHMIICVSMERVSIIKDWGDQWSISSLRLYIHLLLELTVMVCSQLWIIGSEAFNCCSTHC